MAAQEEDGWRLLACSTPSLPLTKSLNPKPYKNLVCRPKTFLHGTGVAVGIAIFNGVGAIGGFAGPYVVGSLVEQGGYDKCMYVLGALFAALGALILSARPSLPPPSL